MSDEQDQRQAELMPYAQEKIPVCSGVAELQSFMDSHPGFVFCPYLAQKDDEGWAISTSRVYMNQIMPGFLYVPVNITRGDTDSLQQLFGVAANDPRVVAVNITQPHKSNDVVKAMFLQDPNSDANVDTLIRGQDGNLHPYDRDAPAFVGWFNEDAGPFQGKDVFVVGVGGAGEPIARLIAKQVPRQLVLVDPRDKSGLAEQLRALTHVEYRASLDGTLPKVDGGNLVVINAAGKEGIKAGRGIAKLLSKYASHSNVFVDIRPQLKIEIVETAAELGWQAYTGHGMNAHNDYALACAIAKYMGITPPTFHDFQACVAKAS